MQKKASSLTLKENYRERALEKNYHFILKEGVFRGQIIHAPRMIREMAESHKLGPLETLILGQAYMGVLIMAANLKEEGRIQLNLDCQGPLGGLSAEADKHGAVRGYLKHNPIPLTEEGKWEDMASIFGSGTMSVTRLEEQMKAPHSSKVLLQYGNLSQDLAQYYLDSEQIPSFFNLSLDFNKEGELLEAGALFLQVLPGASEADIEALEKAALKIPSLGESFSSGVQPEEFLQAHLGEFTPKVLKKTPVEFFCPCSKDRLGKFLKTLKKGDRKDIMKGAFPMEMKCHNCNSAYSFEKKEVEDLFKD